MIIVANAFLFNDDWTDFTFLWYFCFRKVIGLVLTHTLEEKNTTKSGYKAPTPMWININSFKTSVEKRRNGGWKRCFFPLHLLMKNVQNIIMCLNALSCSVRWDIAYKIVPHACIMTLQCIILHMVRFYFFLQNYILNVFQDLQVLSSSKCHDDI